MERQLAQAQLKVLQMQLHPHFLFNTLHAIGTLVYEDPKSAEHAAQSGVLRPGRFSGAGIRAANLPTAGVTPCGSLSKHSENPLQGSADCALCHRPRHCGLFHTGLLLQPLVENAIVHGIARNPGNDEIEISSSRQRDKLVIQISNANSTLPGEVRPDGGGWGVGLSNTMQRLAQTYNGGAALIDARSPRGVVCEVSVPFAKGASELTAAEELLAL